MKKSIKKLSINKVTVADLNSKLLGRVKAGICSQDPLVESLETDCVNVYACNPQSHFDGCITKPTLQPTCHVLETGAECN